MVIIIVIHVSLSTVILIWDRKVFINGTTELEVKQGRTVMSYMAVYTLVHGTSWL